MSQHKSRKYLPHSKSCFVCGEENPAGLQTRFYIEEGKVKTPFNVHLHHCGYHDAVHGGVIAAAMDECMGWAVGVASGRMFLTAELNIRYLQKVPAAHDLTIVAEVVRTGRRLSEAKGELLDAAGTVYATGTARFVPMSEADTLAVDRELIYTTDASRPFRSLQPKSD